MTVVYLSKPMLLATPIWGSLVALFYPFLFATVQSSADDLQAVGAAIRAANHDYHASVNTLHVEFTIDIAHFGPSRFEMPKGVITWIRAGRKELLRTDPHYEYRNGDAKVWTAWNGKERVRLAYFNYDRDVVYGAACSDVFPDEISQCAIPALALGWRLRASLLGALNGQSVSALLETADPTTISKEPARILIGPDEYMEVPAYKWPIKRVLPEVPNGSVHTLTVWFDPENGWLPRMWTYYPDLTSSGQTPADSQAYAVAIGDYIDVPDRLTGSTRRFPKTMYVYGPGDQKCVVESVSVNEPVPDSVFEPTLTPGAEIIRNEGTRDEVRSNFGGPDGEKVHQEHLTRELAFSNQQNPQPLSPSDPVNPIPASGIAVDASPGNERSALWRSIILVASIMSLVGAMWFRFRFK
ncbi:MAG: hypothetical protein NTX48_06870 [Planctomycetales bacterium]|nr:hypothetical protein [Planctomycetales bacterium]